MDEQVRMMEMQHNAAKIVMFKTNHVLHLLLSLISAGIWIPVWLIVTLSNAIERAKANSKIKKLMEQGRRSTDRPS